MRGRFFVFSLYLTLLLMSGCISGTDRDAGTKRADTPGVPGNSEAEAEVPFGSQVGNRIPDFNLSLVDGTNQSTAQLASSNRPVFLFFFATW